VLNELVVDPGPRLGYQLHTRARSRRSLLYSETTRIVYQAPDLNSCVRRRLTSGTPP
jgi:hypothetical protein